MNLADSPVSYAAWLFSLDCLRIFSLYSKSLSLQILWFYMARHPSEGNCNLISSFSLTSCERTFGFKYCCSAVIYIKELSSF